MKFFMINWILSVSYRVPSSPDEAYCIWAHLIPSGPVKKCLIPNGCICTFLTGFFSSHPHGGYTDFGMNVDFMVRHFKC
jgi:hypothetical protein